MKIEKIDKNFAAEVSGEGSEIVYYEIDEDGFELNGFPWFKDENVLCRLPRQILPETNPGVQTLAYCSSGGALRFQTDSSKIRIKAELNGPTDMNHMPRTGSSGFDLYVGAGKEKKFLSNIVPAANITKVEGIFKSYETKRMREYTVYFPLYNGVKSLQVGLASDSEIKAPSPFSVSKPIVFYGASITQGGCASRPGNAFTHLLGRWLDTDFVNLGFSGSSRGEIVIADAINSLEMSLLCIDYDQGELDDFQERHEKFFKRIREKNPTLPIVIIAKRDPMPDYEDVDDALQQKIEKIRNTYEDAVKNNDQNVYYIDHEGLFDCKYKDVCTVDGVHPNDYGFIQMAQGLFNIIRGIIPA
jgi:lysophospholipase L1-like esterase